MSSFNAGKIEADLTLGRSQWMKDLRKTQKEINDLERRGITIGIDADDTNARVVMDNLELLLDDLDRSTYTPSIDATTTEAVAALERLEVKLDAMDGREVGITADADTTNAQIQLDNLEREIEELDREGIRIPVEVLATDAHAELDRLALKAQQLDSRVIGIEADADITNAMVQLDILENQMDVLENDPINIRADADLAQIQTDLIELATFVNALDNSDIGIHAELDGYATVNAQMLTLAGQATVLDGMDIGIDVDMDRDMLESLVGGASGGGGGGGGYLGLLRILIYAIIILSPVLAVAMSSATASIVAFAAAVSAAGAAALILGGGLVGLVQRFKDTDPSDYTPAMQNFADAIEAVSDAWNVFLDGIEGPGFNLMAQGLQLVADILPDFIPLFNATADAMSGVLDGIASWTDSPQYQEMLDFFGGFGVDMLVSFLEIGGNLLTFFGELFAAIEPFAREMMTGLENLTQGWSDWAAELDENRAFQEFMENASTYGPMVLDMLGSLLQAFMNLGRALEPFAGPMLEALTWFFDLIANADPDNLTAIIGLFAGMWAGANILLPVLTGIGGAMSAIAFAAGTSVGVVAAFAGAIGIVVAAIVDLWRENGAFRDSVMNVWQEIKDTVLPIVEDIWAKIQENWGPISAWASEIFESVKTIITDAMLFIEDTIVPVLDGIQFAWENWGDELFAVLEWFFGIVGPMITGGFDVIEGIFKTVTSLLKGDWQGAWDGIKKIAEGGLAILEGLFRLFMEPLRAAWDAISGAVTRKWQDMLDALERKWGEFRTWIEGRWQAFKDWVSGWGVKASDLWADFTARWTTMRENISAKWEAFKTWVSGWAPNLPSIWDDIVTKWTEMKTSIDTKWTNFKSDVAGWVIGAVNIFDPIKENFRGVLNAIVAWWNDFSLTVDIPDKIPGLPDSFTISTPNVGGYAKGAYVPGNQPHLAWFGEGPDNEVVAPEPILRKIVTEHSGGNVDPAIIAAAIVTALAPVLRPLGLSIDRLTQIIIEAGVGMTIDARVDGDGSNAAANLAREIAYQIRLAGFGGQELLAS